MEQAHGPYLTETCNRFLGRCANFTFFAEKHHKSIRRSEKNPTKTTNHDCKIRSRRFLPQLLSHTSFSSPWHASYFVHEERTNRRLFRRTRASAEQCRQVRRHQWCNSVAWSVVQGPDTDLHVRPVRFLILGELCFQSWCVNSSCK